MSSTSSDDEILGAEAEQEYERSLDRAALAEQMLEEPAPVKQAKPKKSGKRQRLTNAERLRLIDEFRQGKTDKFFNVIPNKNKPGDYRIIRRRKPLDVPIADNNSEPIKIAPEPVASEPVKEQEPKPEKNDKKEKYNTEFYTMQNTINNSLSKEIAAVMEKCNKIEAKMKKQKQKMRAQRNVQRQYVPEEYGEEYGEESEDNEYYPHEQPMDEEPEYAYYPYRYSTRRRIDLRNF